MEEQKESKRKSNRKNSKTPKPDDSTISSSSKMFTFYTISKEKKQFPKAPDALKLEKEFKMVRIHLEGKNHTVLFPNKQTGEFDNIDATVPYIVYGHPFNESDTWKPKQDIKRDDDEFVPADQVIYEGKLKIFKKSFFGKGKWEEKKN